MSVLHVVAPADIGGLERVVQMLATSQLAAGREVRVLAILAGVPAEVGPRFLQPLADAGVPVHAARLPARAYLRERAAVAEVCRLHRPEIVHTHGYRPDVVDAGVARSLARATVTTFHGFTGGGLRNRCYELLQLRAARRCDAVVAVSRPLAERLRGSGVRADRLHVVPNAWRGGGREALARATARRALSLPDDGFVVGWVGRLSEEKGPDLLLDALALAPDVPLQAVVVGDGRERAALERRARRAGLRARVEWKGAVPGAERLFRAFDALVLSSRTEGTPIVLFEAMAAGVPIVATRVGGVPDMLSPREAELVPSGDPAALAAAIRGIHRDPGAAAAKARVARERLCREFQAEPWIERYEAVYRAALARAGEGR